MSNTISVARSLRDGNETWLSGTEAFNAQNVERINAVIPANTVDHPVSLGDFRRSEMAAILFKSTLPLTVKLRGDGIVRAQPFDTIVYVAGDLVVGDGGSFTTLGDFTGFIFPGDTLWLEGSATAQHNGLCEVVAVAYAAPNSTIEVTKRLSVINGIIIETFNVPGADVNDWYKIVPRSRKYNIDAADDITVIVGPSEIEIAEDLSWLKAGDRIVIEEATSPGNDLLLTVVSATWDGADTTIVVAEALDTVEAGNADCTLMAVLAPEELQYEIALAASVPHMWSYTESILNPCDDEEVTTLLVTNPHATEAADLEGRIARIPT